MSQAYVIVVGNEKGGAGKSTVAVHLAVALLREGARVAAIDLDVRQQSMGHFFANRVAWSEANNAPLPLPLEMTPVADVPALDAAMARAADVVLIDTPGADTELARQAHRRANLIVTPMNDSFVDFDVLGHVDPVSLEVVRPSLYALTVWEARKARAARREGVTDWVVLRNRLASTAVRNRKRVDEKLLTLARRVGFPGDPGAARPGHLSRTVSVRLDGVRSVAERASGAGVAQPCRRAPGDPHAVAGSWAGRGRRAGAGGGVIFLAIGAAVFAALVWAGRRRSLARDDLRLIRAFAAAMAAVAAVVAGLRGLWIASLALVAASIWLGRSVRSRRPTAIDTDGMSDSRARSMLDVGPQASREEIEAAYRRLIRRVHPDVGGAGGLAAELNAARDRLLK